MDLYGVLEPTIVGLGYELVDLELSNRGRLIRLFIDKPIPTQLMCVKCLSAGRGGGFNDRGLPMLPMNKLGSGVLAN